MKQLTITKQVQDQINQTIGRFSPETGGILGSSDGGKTVDHYYFDHSAKTSSGTYSPDTATVNHIIAMWNQKDVELIGVIHSHPKGNTAPSHGDAQYVKSIMNALNIPGGFFMVIAQVASPPNGKTTLYPYTFQRGIELLNQPITLAKDYTNKLAKPSISHIRHTEKERFKRIENLYSLRILRQKTAVCIGLGGTRGFVEELARSGVGHFVLMDGDRVDASNIATQQVYISEIGRSKAEVLRDRILEINPKANITTVPRFLDDSMTDEEFSKIVGSKLLYSPKDVLICGCTDSFPAQVRSACLAMKYGTPYLAGQVYQEGLGAEIYFSYPGVTKACPRCALKSRYNAYLNGYTNTVTSDSAPIFATTRVNATKGQIALMLLLYHEDKTSVYNSMLDYVANRNFVMIRMSPIASERLGINIFYEAMNGSKDLGFFDETLWIPQEVEHDCPLCKGKGDLSALKKHIPDSREHL